MQTISINVYGKVQGVGFRYATLKLANNLGILGIVKNKNNGSVYIEAQANNLILERFISLIKKSPSKLGYVDKIIINKIENKHFNNFSIIY